MRYEFPFSEEFHNKITTFMFNWQWKKTLDSHKTIWLFIGLALVLFVLFFLRGEPFGYVFLGLIVFYGMQLAKSKSQYNKIKTEYSNRVDKLAFQFKASQEPIVWELKEDRLHYSDCRTKLEFIWSMLGKLQLEQDFMVINPSAECPFYFAINKESLPEADYLAIKEFLSTKLVGNS